jgi:Flp pilus assembly protein TadB
VVAESGATYADDAGFSDSPSSTMNGAKKRPLNAEELETVRRYKSRSAVITAVAVAMYILCWLPLVILSTILGDLGSTIGLPIMFGMIAAATCMLIYNGMTKPKFGGNVEDWDDDDDDDDDDEDEDVRRGCRPARSPAYKAISGVLWMLTVCVYFLVSFASGAWHITWLIFLIATALDNVIKAIFDLRR